MRCYYGFLKQYEVRACPLCFNLGGRRSSRRKGGARKPHNLQFGVNYDKNSGD